MLFLWISIKRLYLLFWICTRWKHFTHLLNYNIFSFAKNTHMTMVCSACYLKFTNTNKKKHAKSNSNVHNRKMHFSMATKQPIALRVTLFESHSLITSFQSVLSAKIMELSGFCWVLTPISRSHFQAADRECFLHHFLFHQQSFR